MSRFSCILPWAGWVHWQSFQIVVELNWLSQFTCHSLPWKSPKDHASSLCFIVSFSGYLLLWGANLIFSLFPSLSLSCSSTWRSVAWVCHEDIFIIAEKFPHLKTSVQLQNAPDEEEECCISLLGCAIVGFFAEDRREQGQEIFTPKGKIRSYLKWRTTSKTSIRIIGAYKARSE